MTLSQRYPLRGQYVCSCGAPGTYPDHKGFTAGSRVCFYLFLMNKIADESLEKEQIEIPDNNTIFIS